MYKRQARLSLRQAEERVDEFYENYGYILYYTVTLLQTEKDLNLLSDWSERNVVVTEEQTAYSIVNAMNEISLKQVEVESAKEALAQAEKTCETNRLRYEAGAISRRELIESEAAVETAEQQIHTKETELQGPVSYTHLTNLRMNQFHQAAVRPIGHFFAAVFHICLLYTSRCV